MTDWIGETFTSDAGWSHLEQLVDIGNRLAGSDGERRAAAATRDALEDVGGRDAHLDAFDIQGWTRGTSSIHAGETPYACLALPRSPSGEATGELIDVGYGLPEDFDRDLEGAIVMAASNVPPWYDRFLHRREKYYQAVKAGAAGFIFRNHVEGCLAPTGSVGSPQAPIGEIPAIGVSKETGAKLARLHEGETIEMTVEAEIDDATSQNVHAAFGPDTEQELLLTAHVDAHDIAEGAGDNGAGTALTVEIAKALARREDDLETRVHVIVFGAEEVGLCGSMYDSEQRDRGKIKAIVNNDGVVRGRTLSFTTHGFDELVEAVEDVGERFDHPVLHNPKLGPHSDHWPYVRWGVPGTHVMSKTDYEGRGWGHTAADTLDKLAPRDLREQAILLTEVVVELSDKSVEIPHREAEEIAEQLVAEDLAENMRLTGDWPY